MSSTALIAVVLLAIITVFQLALAAGAPWGVAAWGGQHPGTLPRKLRIASAVVGLVVYPLMAVVLLAADGAVTLSLPMNERITLWGLTAFLGLGALANLASRSKIERIWAPVAAVLALCCALIALR